MNRIRGIKNRLLIPLLLLAMLAPAHRACAQDVAVKTDLLYWLAGGTINAEVEVASSSRVTWDLLAAYNPWNFSDGRKMHLWLVQPEVRYWFCERFEGHFLAAHVFGGEFFGGFSDRLYDGFQVGAGIGYGYSWLLSDHWSLEVELAVGYSRLSYKESERQPCYTCRNSKHRNYIGPTKAAISIVYVF